MFEDITRRFYNQIHRTAQLLNKQLSRSKTRRPNQFTFRPKLEYLEDREVPAVTFAGQVTFATGSLPSSVTMGDFNNDGRSDLVTANNLGSSVSVFLNTTMVGATTASFATQQTFSVGVQPITIAVGDFNGDGRSDIVTANYISNSISLLLNTTTPGATIPSFSAQQTFAAGTQTYGVAVGDLNEDGRADIATTSYNTNSLTVFLNTTSAGASSFSFTTPQSFSINSGPSAISIADLNSDGRQDLIATNFESQTFSLLLNTTAAGSNTSTFGNPQNFSTNTGPLTNPYRLCTTDLNADGRPDLAIAEPTTGIVIVHLNTTVIGASTVTLATRQTFTVGGSPVGVEAADFNGDGRPDLVVANSTSATLSVLLNTAVAGAAAASFAAEQTFTVGTTPYSPVASDFNGDGRADIAVANQGSNTLSVLLNTTTPFQSTIPIVAIAIPGYGVWQFNRIQGWSQLTTANASLVVCNTTGTIIGNFTGYGLWQYKPTTGWQSLNTPDATTVATDANGNIAASFNGYGVYLFRPAAGWQSLGTVDANLISMDAIGNIYANFTGYGIWRYRPTTGFQQLSGVDAALITVNAKGDLVANFTNYGVYLYRAYTGWSSLSPVSASAISVDANGNITASFTGYGVNLYRLTTGWVLLTPTAATLLSSDAFGNIYSQFNGFGIYEYLPSQGWVIRLATANVSKLFVA